MIPAGFITSQHTVPVIYKRSAAPNSLGALAQPRDMSVYIQATPMYYGGGALGPDEEGPGVRATKLREKAESTFLRHSGFTEKEKNRLRFYRQVVDLMLRDASDAEIAEILNDCYRAFRDELMLGGFLVQHSSVWEATLEASSEA